ncbi:MAG: hypothetical protein IIB55_04385 [Planctomycetes bacterium]|nr:hypothetical protein [Planctomycetota bacterium]
MEPNHPQQSTDAPNADERQSDAVNILADMEARLHGLRELHENQCRKEAELTQREQAANELNQRLRLAQQQFETDRAQFESQHNDLVRQHADLQRHCESLAHEQTQTQARAEQLSAELESARRQANEAGTREHDLAVCTQHAAQLEDSLQKQRTRSQEAEALAAERGEELLRVHENISELSNHAESSRNAIAVAENESAGLREQIASLQERVGERERELAQTQSQFETVRDRADRSVDLESQRDQALNELGQLKAHLQTKLTEAARRTDQLTRELEAADARSEEALHETSKREQLDADAMEHCHRRRKRLALIRTEMKLRKQKVSQAVEKLRERNVECQRILAQRRDVDRGRAEVRKKRREAERLITRYKGGKYLMYIMVAVVLLAGLSWGVASHFVSATYLASATIQAQNKDRDLEIYELNEWQDYHEELLADQQFHIMAAERFRRRGLENFGEASAVGDLIRTSTHHRSTQAGELTIELSGKGAQRTELVLNTLVTSIRSYSEAAKAQRTDGATTIISSDAAVGDAPLTNTTPIYAAGLFLAAFMLTLGIAAPTWKNLSKSKREFEQQAKADEIGAQADWVEPEKLAKPIRTSKA